MSLKLKSLFLASICLSLSGAVKSADMTENNIPAGWELSATLALFRNMPFIDPASFPASSGDVYFSHSDDFRMDKDQIFTNTYKFYRQIDGGKFLELTVVEEQTMGATAEGSAFLKVADLSQSLATVNSRPQNAVLYGDLSKLLGYIFDHRQSLLDSQAGDLAKQLNYGSQGRNRPTDYSQPRVSFVEGQSGVVEKLRIYGLAALMGEQNAVAVNNVKAGDPVLEVSVDNSGVAQVSFSSQNP